MIDREKIIREMCYTMRHDFGIEKTEDNISSGMTVKERNALWSSMSQLFDHHIWPLVEFVANAEREACAKVCEDALNQSKTALFRSGLKIAIDVIRSQ